MQRSLLCLAVAFALVASGSDVAAKKPAAGDKSTKKLYRWVDKAGKVHYDDALPPEAIDQARQELSAKSGVTTASIDRAMTEEERAQQAAAVAAAAQAAELAQRQALQDQTMMTTFGSEDALRHSYEERTSLLQQSLEVTQLSIKSLRVSLASQLSDAATAELGGKPITAQRDATVRKLHADLLGQQQYLKNRETELNALDQEYARVLARYRELKATPAAATPAAGAAPAATTAPAPAGG